MSVSALKKLGAFCAILVLAWLFTLYHRIPHNKAPYVKALDQAQRIEIARNTHHVVFVKKGKDWAVAGDPAGPFFDIEEDRWRTLQSGLRDLKLEDVISERADRAADFEVDPASGTQVRLLDAHGATLVDGFFGKSAQDALHLYFRYAGQPAVYIARGLFREDLAGADLNGWRSHALTAVSEDAVTSFKIETPRGVVDVRQSSPTWTVNGQPADADKVNTWLGAFAHLRADDFADPEAAKSISTNTATVSATSAAGTVTLRIGPLDPKLKRYAVATSDGRIAWVSEPHMAPLLLPPSDLRKK